MPSRRKQARKAQRRRPRQRPVSRRLACRACGSSPLEAPSPIAAADDLSAEELVASIPGVERYVRPEFEQFANVASGSLTLRQWVDSANRINAIFAEDTDLAGVVVTSGTDTLEETAYFLDLTVRSDKPVVVVGSMRNPSALGYEGLANLLEGYRVAADPRSRGKGVLVVLNDEINSARDVTKTDAHRLDTFQSRTYGILGVVDSTGSCTDRDVVKRHAGTSEFDISAIDELPRVDVVMTYQGATGDVIKAMVDLGAKGIVIAAAAPAPRAERRTKASATRWRKGCSSSSRRGPAAVGSQSWQLGRRAFKSREKILRRSRRASC